MPHLTIEYTSNVTPKIDCKALFGELHQLLADVGKVQIGNCKSRSRVAEDFYIADGGEEHAFVHLDLRLLEGRSPQWKREIGEQCLHILSSHFGSTAERLALQITVSILDIERATYFKYPEGTL